MIWRRAPDAWEEAGGCCVPAQLTDTTMPSRGTHSSPRDTRQAQPLCHRPLPCCVTCWHTQFEPSCTLTAAPAPLRSQYPPTPCLNGAAPPGMELAAASLPWWGVLFWPTGLYQSHTTFCISPIDATGRPICWCACVLRALCKWDISEFLYDVTCKSGWTEQRPQQGTPHLPFPRHREISVFSLQHKATAPSQSPVLSERHGSHATVRRWSVGCRRRESTVGRSVFLGDAAAHHCWPISFYQTDSSWKQPKLTQPDGEPASAWTRISQKELQIQKSASWIWIESVLVQISSLLT